MNLKIAIAAVALAGTAQMGGSASAQLGEPPPVLQNPPAPPRTAPAVPESLVLEALVKNTLATLNDANRTNNYTVMHAMGHPDFRATASVEELARNFAVFRQRQIDFAYVLSYRPNYTEGPAIGPEGRLAMKAYFDTRPSRVSFEATYAQDAGVWRIWRIYVNVRPAAAP